MEAPTAEVRPDASTVIRWPSDAPEPSWSVIQAHDVEHVVGHRAEHTLGHAVGHAGGHAVGHADYQAINPHDVEPDTVTDRDRMAPLEEKLGRAVELADTLGVLLQGLPQPQRTASAHIHRELRQRLVEAQALLLRR